MLLNVEITRVVDLICFREHIKTKWHVKPKVILQTYFNTKILYIASDWVAYTDSAIALTWV